MTQFRTHLESLRHQYVAETYPGDLANQLLRGSARQLPSHWRWAFAGVGAAAAAAIALAVLLYDPATDAVGNSFHRIAQAIEFPFAGPNDAPAGHSPEPFTIIPEFRQLDVPVPAGGISATEESA